MAASLPQVAVAETTVEVLLSRDTIGMDEQAVMTVRVSGEEQNLPAPKMPALGMFEVYSQGRSTNMSIYNGQVTASVTYKYLLIPTRPGSYPITGIAVVHKGKRYPAPQVELTVLDKGVAAEPQLEDKARSGKGSVKDYFMTAEVDRKNPYVNQQVTLTLK
ncbi:MAG: BatD family protein, partial [candidate division Zixibacteria bacterium]